MTFSNEGSDVRVIPGELCELPTLRGFEGTSVLEGMRVDALREYVPGDVLVESGRPAEEVVLIAHDKMIQRGTGKCRDQAVLGVACRRAVLR